MGAAAILNIHRGGEFVKSVPIDGEAVVGRGEGCVIRLDDRAVSRQHAVFKTSSGGVLVERKSEFAPVLLNGVDCESGVLQNGDVVAIGPYVVRVEMKPEAKKAEVAPVSAAALEVSQTEPLAQEAVLEPAFGEQPVSSTAEDDAFADLGEPMVRPANSSGSPSSEAAEEESVEGEPEQAESFQPNSANQSFDQDEKTKILTNTDDVLVKLVLSEGTANVTEFEVTKDRVTIGRDGDCDIILQHEKKCSRKHAVVKKLGMSFTLEDLSSANGTLLNGETVTESGLSGGDVIQIGETKILFKAKTAEGKDLRSPDATQTQVSLPELMSRGSTVVQGVGPALGSEPGTSMAGSAMTSAIAPLNNVVDEGFTEKAHTAFMNLSKMNAVSVGSFGEGTSATTSLEGSDEDAKPKNFIEQIKAWPKKKKIIWGSAAVVIAISLLFGNPEEEPPTKPAADASQKAVGFDALNADQKKFIQDRYKSAQKHFEAQEYDEALFDLKKIFEILADYEPARELEKYINEKKRLKALAEVEKKRREEDVKLKERLVEIEKAIESFMKDKRFAEAKDLFPSVLALDPNSEKVPMWEKRILEEELKQQAIEERKRVEKKLNENAWMAYKAANALRKQGKCLEAIESFQEVMELEVTDRRPLKMAQKGVAGCLWWIKSKRDPMLARAKRHEAAQELDLAYRDYRQANQIDPGNAIAVAGMNRIKGVLHDRARVLFNEAIVAESYSDFDTAYKKFKECAAIAPEEDVYYERSYRKITRYRGDRVFGDGGDGSARVPASVSAEQAASNPSPEFNSQPEANQAAPSSSGEPAAAPQQASDRSPSAEEKPSSDGEPPPAAAEQPQAEGQQSPSASEN